MLGRMLFATIMTIVLSSSMGLAQVADPSTYVRQLHQQYLGRDPSSYEQWYWVDQMNRGMSPREVQAFVIASEAYFERYRRNVDAWIAAAIVQVERRNPTVEEQNYWTQRYRTLNQNRLVWAKELVRRTPGATPGMSPVWSPDWSKPASGLQPADVPARLVDTSQLLTQAVATEVTGSNRWLVQLQANNLLSTATTSKELFSRAGVNTSDAVTAVGYLDQAVATLHASLNQLGYTTPSSQHYLAQIGDLVAELRKTYPSAPQSTLRLPAPPSQFEPAFPEPARPDPTFSPVAPLAPVSAYAPVAPATPSGGDVAQSVADLQQACRSMVLLVRSRNSREPTYDRLLRDIESMSASVGLFRSNLQFGYAIAEQRKHVQDLQRQSGAVNRSLQSVGFDAQLSQMWHDVTAALNVVATDVGLGQSAAAWTQSAVPAARPTFSRLPVNLPPPPASTSFSSDVIVALDQAVSQCDALIAAYGLYGYYTPGVPQLIAELRTERNALSDLRRQVAQGSPGSADNALRQINDQHRRVTASWNQAAASSQFRSAPTLNDLGAAIGRVNQAMNYYP